MGEQIADIPGLPPPVDYIDSMLCYSRYVVALRDIEESAEAIRLMVERDPEKLGHLTDAERIEVIVRNAATIRGQGSGLFGLPELPRGPIMNSNIETTARWREEQVGQLDSDGETRLLEQVVVNALTYSAITFFQTQGQLTTHSAVFEPTVERFTLLTRVCDWPVIEYDDGLEVFFCDPHPDPQPVVGHQLTAFELARTTRRLLTEHCPTIDSSWSMTVLGRPVTDVVGVASEQLSP